MVVGVEGMLILFFCLWDGDGIVIGLVFSEWGILIIGCVGVIVIGVGELVVKFLVFFFIIFLLGLLVFGVINLIWCILGLIIGVCCLEFIVFIVIFNVFVVVI